MAHIKPDGSGATPLYWRNAWDVFRKMQAIAKKMQTDTSEWHISVPPKGLKMFKGWELRYTPPGERKAITIGIGQNAQEAINALTRFHSLWVEWARQQIEAPPPTTPKKRRRVAMDSPSHIVAYADLLDEQMKRNPNLEISPWYWKHIGSQKAGFLDINMYTYLRTEIGRLFPVPPKNKQQWEEYKKQFNYVEEQQRKARQHVKENERRPATDDSVHGFGVVPMRRKN